MSSRTMPVRIAVWVDHAGVWGAGRDMDDAWESYYATENPRDYDPETVSHRRVWVTAEIPVPDPPPGEAEVAGEVGDG